MEGLSTLKDSYANLEVIIADAMKVHTPHALQTTRINTDADSLFVHPSSLLLLTKLSRYDDIYTFEKVLEAWDNVLTVLGPKWNVFALDLKVNDEGLEGRRAGRGSSRLLLFSHFQCLRFFR